MSWLQEEGRKAKRRGEVRRLLDPLVSQVGSCTCGKDYLGCLIEFLEFYSITQGMEEKE